MKTNKLWSIMVMLTLMLGTAVSLSSCGGDDDDDNQGSGNNSSSSTTSSSWGQGTWYAYNSYINDISVKKSDFEEIEKAIDNNELLDEINVSRYNSVKYYATRDKFVDSDGRFGGQGRLGRLSNIIYPYLNCIRIVDATTLLNCYFEIFVDEDMKSTGNMKKVATLFNGHIFKSVSLYLEERYYTYAKQDNKIIVSNGDIYTVTSEGLIKDGSSEPLVQCDPLKVYGIK